MEILNFISDDQLRESLITDYKELEKCLENNCLKAVYVLAGSIIETVLVDYLLTIDSANKKRILNFTLGSLIDECFKISVISEKVKNLMIILRDFRNLLHPGRKLRLNEEITKQGAKISKELVDMILDEINKKKKVEYGYTADQLLEKIIYDSSVPSIIEHLIKDMNENEIIKLLINKLPGKYIEIDINLGNDFFDIPEIALTTIKNCFKIILNNSNTIVKTKVVNAYLNILKESNEYNVECYDRAFVNLNYLHLLDSPKRNIIIDHFLSKLNKSIQIELLDSSDGIGMFLSGEKAIQFSINLIKQRNMSFDPNFEKKCLNRLYDEYRKFKKKDQGDIIEKLNVVIKRQKQLGNNSTVKEIESIRVNLIGESLPF